MASASRDRPEDSATPASAPNPLVAAIEESSLASEAGALAVVLGGSQARGEAVWVEAAGRRACLSDVDLHLVLPGGADPARAARSAGRARLGLEARLAALGLAAPLEIGLHPAAEWERLPARPATLELRRHGRVLAGDPAWLARLPDWRPRDVPPEERLLLLENRAFELIAALRDHGAGGPLGPLKACHARYKVALDLALVERLSAGALEDDPAERVRAARAARPRPREEEPAWEAALGWRAGRVPEPGAREADAWRITAAWVAAWSAAAAPSADPRDFERVARAAAGRARLRRRLRLAVGPGIRRGLGPPLASRLGRALSGTPQHRLNASAGAFLAARWLAHAEPREEAAIRARLARTLARLGVVRPGPDDDAVAAALLGTWERWVAGATREAGRP